MSLRLPSSLSATVEHEIVVKKSRFLAHAAPADSAAEADVVVAGLRKQYWDARHHCVAAVLGDHAETQRSTDDGEPSGTAGAPMLEVLRHRRITDVVVVVTRWFGGTLLGTGGLVRAYSGAVSAVLDEAEARGLLVTRRAVVEVTLDAPHADAGRVDHLVRDWATTHGAVMGETQYSEVARLVLLVPPAELASLRAEVAAATQGALAPLVGDERVVDLPA